MREINFRLAFVGFLLLAFASYTAAVCGQDEFVNGSINNITVIPVYGTNGSLVTGALCNVNLTYGNGTWIVSNAVMMFDGNGTYYYGYTPTSLGYYRETTACVLGTYGARVSQSFESVRECASDTLFDVNSTANNINSTVTAINTNISSSINRIYIQAQVPVVVYKNNAFNASFSFMNASSILSTLGSLNITTTYPNGSVFDSVSLTSVSLFNGIYNYSFNISSTFNGIWLISVNASNTVGNGVGVYNFRLASSGPYDFSIVPLLYTQNNTIPFYVNLTNFGGTVPADGTLITWLADRSDCASVMAASYSLEQVLQPAEGVSFILPRQKVNPYPFKENATYYVCGTWNYDSLVQPISAVGSFVFTVEDFNPGFPYPPAGGAPAVYPTTLPNGTIINATVTPTPLPLSGAGFDYFQYWWLLLVAAVFCFFIFKRKGEEE